uniref:eS1 n=1 Tax=Paranosema locustae TaxID=235221 RepID=UPI00187D6E2B|nr:Chain SB0, eS1 [Paranosema locustae]|eukprot:jgi/Antlo1/196/931
MAKKDQPVTKKSLKKGLKKKATDSFAKKEWFSLRIPSGFVTAEPGKTLCTKQNTKANLEKYLLGRNFEVNQGDLNPGNEESAVRKFRFIVNNVNGRIAESEFNGMELTTEKKRGIVRKWHTLIEAFRDVCTKDGYHLRVFVTALTKHRPGSVSRTCYAKTSDVKKVRRLMFEVIENEVSGSELAKVVKKLSVEKLGKEIEKKASVILPLQNCYTAKVKVVKRPRPEVIRN